MTAEIVNIAGYRFVDLPDRDKLRAPSNQLVMTRFTRYNFVKP